MILQGAVYSDIALIATVRKQARGFLNSDPSKALKIASFYIKPYFGLILKFVGTSRLLLRAASGI
jgi:hypothetical protein